MTKVKTQNMASITPCVDIAFKKIFGVEENKDLLISLINSMVSEEDQVAEIILLNPYKPKNFYKDKLSVLDIKAKSVDGKHFNVEIQLTDEADYDKRALYYWAKLYTEQLQEGKSYSKLNKTIGIHILNFLSIPEFPNYHNVFHITHDETGKPYFSELELHTVELKKFSPDEKEELSELIDKVKNSLDMWVAFLTRHDLLRSDNLPKEFSDANLQKALSILEVMNFNFDEREIYEGRLKWIRMEESALRKVSNDSRAEGKAEGRAEGIIEGEIKRQTKIARNMLKHNLPIETIQKVTELTINEIEKIRR